MKADKFMLAMSCLSVIWMLMSDGWQFVFLFLNAIGWGIARVLVSVEKEG